MKDDAILVEQVRQGNPDAFEEIARRYHKKLLGFLSKYTRCYSQAEDIIQQTFLKAFQSFDSLRDGEKLGAWLYQIAYRLVVDQSRQKKTVPLENEQLIPDSRITPEQFASDSEERANLWSTAQVILTEDEFSVIWLRYAEEHSIEEIASILSRTNGSIRVLLFRARKKLLAEVSANKDMP